MATPATYASQTAHTVPNGGHSIRHRLTVVLGMIALALLATVTATGASAHSRVGIAPTNPISLSQCPNTTVAVPNKDDFRSNAANTTFDAEGASLTQRPGTPDYALQVNRGGGNGDCIVGLTISGANPSSTTWSHLKACCDAAGVFAQHSLAAFNVRMNNVSVDDFRMINADGNDSYFIGDSELTNTRDDCFSTAHGALTVDHTYAECYSIVSWRHTGHDNTPFPVTLSNDLLYLKPAMSGSEDRCRSQMSNGLGSGQVWKMDNYQGSPSLIHVSNTIFRIDQGNDNACQLAWANGTYTNDTVVWTGQGPFPGHLPAGVTLTTDPSVWTNAVVAWGWQHVALVSDHVN